MNRILVVDGDTATRLLCADQLTEEGYDVITGEIGSELIELIAKKRPDVVVVDVMPDDPDGECIWHEITQAYDKLPVILSTVYGAGKPSVGSVGPLGWGGLSSNFGNLKRAVQQAVEGRGQCPPWPMCDARHDAPVQEIM